MEPVGSIEVPMAGDLRKKAIVHINGLKRHECGWPFLEPVDPVALNLPDYTQKIKQPRDLGTISAQLSNNERGEDGRYLFFPTLDSLVRDVRLVFSNCILYNDLPGDADLRNMASTLSKLFERWVNEVYRKPEEFGLGRFVQEQLAEGRMLLGPVDKAKGGAGGGAAGGAGRGAGRGAASAASFDESAATAGSKRKRKSTAAAGMDDAAAAMPSDSETGAASDDGATGSNKAAAAGGPSAAKKRRVSSKGGKGGRSADADGDDDDDDEDYEGGPASSSSSSFSAAAEGGGRGGRGGARKSTGGGRAARGVGGEDGGGGGSNISKQSVSVPSIASLFAPSSPEHLFWRGLEHTWDNLGFQGIARKLPLIGNRIVDLYDLYNRVRHHYGGFDVVNGLRSGSTSGWLAVFRDARLLQGNETTAAVSSKLKKLYERCVLEYERRIDAGWTDETEPYSYPILTAHEESITSGGGVPNSLLESRKEGVERLMKRLNLNKKPKACPDREETAHGASHKLQRGEARSFVPYSLPIPAEAIPMGFAAADASGAAEEAAAWSYIGISASTIYTLVEKETKAKGLWNVVLASVNEKVAGGAGAGGGGASGAGGSAAGGEGEEQAGDGEGGGAAGGEDGGVAAGGSSGGAGGSAGSSGGGGGGGGSSALGFGGGGDGAGGLSLRGGAPDPLGGGPVRSYYGSELTVVVGGVVRTATAATTSSSSSSSSSSVPEPPTTVKGRSKLYYGAPAPPVGALASAVASAKTISVPSAAVSSMALDNNDSSSSSSSATSSSSSSSSLIPSVEGAPSSIAQAATAEFGALPKIKLSTAASTSSSSIISGSLPAALLYYHAALTSPVALAAAGAGTGAALSAAERKAKEGQQQELLALIRDAKAAASSDPSSAAAVVASNFPETKLAPQLAANLTVSFSDLKYTLARLKNSTSNTSAMGSSDSDAGASLSAALALGPITTGLDGASRSLPIQQDLAAVTQAMLDDERWLQDRLSRVIRDDPATQHHCSAAWGDGLLKFGAINSNISSNNSSSNNSSSNNSKQRQEGEDEKKATESVAAPFVSSAADAAAAESSSSSSSADGAGASASVPAAVEPAPPATAEASSTSVSAPPDAAGDAAAAALTTPALASTSTPTASPSLPILGSPGIPGAGISSSTLSLLPGCYGEYQYRAALACGGAHNLSRGLTALGGPVTHESSCCICKCSRGAAGAVELGSSEVKELVHKAEESKKALMGTSDSSSSLSSLSGTAAATAAAIKGWALCSSCPCAICFDCLFPTPQSCGAENEAGRKAFLAAAADRSAKNGSCSAAGQLLLCGASDVGAWSCSACCSFNQGTAKAPTFATLPWCQYCSQPLHGPAKLQDPTDFSATSATYATTVAWPAVLRCDGCRMGLHGLCASRSGAVAGKATLSVIADDSSGGSDSIQAIGKARPIYLCSGCHEQYNAGRRSAFVMPAPLTELGGKGDTPVPSLAAEQRVIMAVAPTREVVVVGKVL